MPNKSHAAGDTPKTIMLTGASRGLGGALVEVFVRKGHRVIGGSRNADAMHALEERHGKEHRFATVNVADEASVSAWARSAIDACGAPDLLINNAAIMNAEAPVWEVPEAEFADVLAINVAGVQRVLRHVLPTMIGTGRGVVVNLSSGWGRSGSPGVGPYCASKWAIEGLTAALALELPKGLAAVALNPGVIDTDMLRKAWGQAAGDYRPASEWAETAAPFLLGLGPSDNGKPLTAPR